MITNAAVGAQPHSAEGDVECSVLARDHHVAGKRETTPNARRRAADRSENRDRRFTKGEQQRVQHRFEPSANVALVVIDVQAAICKVRPLTKAASHRANDKAP